MAIFTPDFTAFFEELARNNNKEWFHAHKKRYERSIKRPFEKLVGALIQHIRKEDPDLQITAKDAILRINRDIRFSKDKSPYNLQVTAFISQGGRKDKSIPGFFIRLSPEMVGIMAGSYGPEKIQLEKIRRAILEQPQRWSQIVKDPKFKKHFQVIRGEQHKRLPSPFKEKAEQLPVLANKQFYVMAQLPPELITNDDLPEELMKYWHSARELNQFLKEAISK